MYWPASTRTTSPVTIRAASESRNNTSFATSSAVPIRFIGIGEKAEDLRPFVAAEFVEALFE